jgi:CRP/FNR family transcriptional regulator
MQHFSTFDSKALQSACSSCSLRELCLPVGLSPEEIDRLDGLFSNRRSVERGHALFRSGEPFDALFPIRTGFFKTRVLSEDGREQVTGFQMSGEILGLDGIGSGIQACDAIALEDSEVCVLPYSELELHAADFPSLQRQLHRILSREIVRDQGVMMLLGNMRAEERIVAFLLNLFQRLATRGFSAHEMVLRMTREEIGSYLGMKIETVSRTLSKLQQEGKIDVNQRVVRILDLDGLRALSAPTCQSLTE